MNMPPSNSVRFDVNELIRAITHSTGYDRINCAMTPAQWEVLGTYLQPFALASGQMLIEQGSNDRTLYLIESGSLSVHVEDEHGQMKLAIVGPGSVVGEGAFFSRLPRNASVVGTGACKLWCMTPLRFREMATRQPAVALELAVGLGAVLAKRMSSKLKQIAVT
ncbi:MAG: Crp/Fnr family transcriptional regulator [Betaproteobacteria bacterium HGW-Betaproteobacteria-3]|jgi:CRP-like cAMP-binding protein|nr:MAG: Crp/Fnr family transcriptional regulator [Betaproteobacteria bacterium HGW-Betaproteobacteria-3]